MNDPNPKVSICVLTWNHEPYIKLALDSVINQSFPNLEIIFLDNCSTDATLQIARSVLADSGVTHKILQNQKPQKVTVNLNRQLQECSGDFITFLSGDDWLGETHIQEQVDYLNQHKEYSLVHSNGFVYYNDIDKYEEVDNGSAPYRQGNLYDVLLFDNVVFTTGVLLKKEVFDDVGVFDEAIAVEDWDLWIRAAKKFKIGYKPSRTTYYRKHSTNFSSRFGDTIGAYIQIIDKHKDHPYYKLARQSVLYHYAINSLDSKQLKSPDYRKSIIKKYKSDAYFRKGIQLYLWNKLVKKFPVNPFELVSNAHHVK